MIDWNFNKRGLAMVDDVYLNADTAGDAAQSEIEKISVGPGRWNEKKKRRQWFDAGCGNSYFLF